MGNSRLTVPINLVAIYRESYGGFSTVAHDVRFEKCLVKRSGRART